MRHEGDVPVLVGVDDFFCIPDPLRVFSSSSCQSRVAPKTYKRSVYLSGQWDLSRGKTLA